MSHAMRRVVVSSVLGLLLGFAMPGWSQESHGAENDPPALSSLFGGKFSLIDHEGVRRSDEDFAGSYLLVSFGYTRCPTICPTDLETASAALDILDRKALPVQPLFVSVDPAVDRPEVLKAYLAPFHPRFIGLTGSEAEVRAAALAYRVHRRRVALDEDSGGGPEGYLVDHGSITHLMGPDGKFLTLFPFGTDAEFMAETIEGYLR
jgi:protein SCO1/2